MNHTTFRRTKVTYDVSAVLLQLAVNADNFEIPGLLICRDKVCSNELTDLRIRQGTCPEFLSIVSRKSLAGEIARNLDQEDEFVLLAG
jgi:hypothetical protein